MSDDTPAIKPKAPRKGGRLVAVADEYEKKLATHDRAAAKAASQMFQSIRKDLASSLIELEKAIQLRFDETGKVPVSWLHRQARYKALIIQANTQANRYWGSVLDVLDTAQTSVIALAEQSSAAMVEAALPGNQAIVGAFHTMPTRALTRLKATMQPGSPLHDLMRRLGGTIGDTIRTELENGLTKGLHPSQITQKILGKVDLTPARAALITRTELYRSFREANRGSYQANADVVKMWVWNAHLGGQTCAACLAMHGTEHPLDEPMGNHPGCRCTSIPKTSSWAELGFPEIDDEPLIEPGAGEAWLRKQDLADQRAAFGSQRGYEGWRDGKYALADAVRVTDHPDWGTNRTVAGYDQALRQAKNRKAREARALAKANAALPPPAVDTRSWDEKARDRIAKGIHTEADVQELGALLHEQIMSPDARAYLKENKDRIDKELADIQTRGERIKAAHATRDAEIEQQIKALKRERETASYDRKREIGRSINTLRDEQDVVKKELNTLRDQYRATKDSIRFYYPNRDDVLGYLEQIRPGYGSRRGLHLQTNRGANSDVVYALEQEFDKFPAEWVDGFRSEFVDAVKVNRGYFRAADGIWDSEIALSDHGEGFESVAIHELTHMAEYKIPKLKAVQKQFYDRRTVGETLEHMGPGYERHEVTRKDQFYSPYIGKDYGNTDTSHFEVASMGVEALMTSGHKYRASLWDDVDYVRFILGILGGV